MVSSSRKNERNRPSPARELVARAAVQPDVALRKTDFLSLAISLSLILLFGTGMDWLLTASGRESFPVVQLELWRGVDQSYGGRYAADRKFEALLSEMPLIRTQALERAQRRIGLVIENPERFVLRFKDYSTASPFGASSQPVRMEIGDGDQVDTRIVEKVKGAGGSLVTGSENQHLHRTLP